MEHKHSVIANVTEYYSVITSCQSLMSLWFHCFPLQSDDACNPDRMYDLISVVIHCGSGLSRGHYISIVKSHGAWVLFDDDIVDVSMC